MEPDANNRVEQPEKITTRKHPSLVRTGKQLVQYNRNKKLEKLNHLPRVTPDCITIPSKAVSHEPTYLYIIGILLIGGTAFYYCRSTKDASAGTYAKVHIPNTTPPIPIATPQLPHTPSQIPKIPQML